MSKKSAKTRLQEELARRKAAEIIAQRQAQKTVTGFTTQQAIRVMQALKNFGAEISNTPPAPSPQEMDEIELHRKLDAETPTLPTEQADAIWEIKEKLLPQWQKDLEPKITLTPILDSDSGKRQYISTALPSLSSEKESHAVSKAFVCTRRVYQNMEKSSEHAAKLTEALGLRSPSLSNEAACRIYIFDAHCQMLQIISQTELATFVMLSHLPATKQINRTSALVNINDMLSILIETLAKTPEKQVTYLPYLYRFMERIRKSAPNLQDTYKKQLIDVLADIKDKVFTQISNPEHHIYTQGNFACTLKSLNYNAQAEVEFGKLVDYLSKTPKAKCTPAMISAVNGFDMHIKEFIVAQRNLCQIEFKQLKADFKPLSLALFGTTKIKEQYKNLTSLAAILYRISDHRKALLAYIENSTTPAVEDIKQMEQIKQDFTKQLDAIKMFLAAEENKHKGANIAPVLDTLSQKEQDDKLIEELAEKKPKNQTNSSKAHGKTKKKPYYQEKATPEQPARAKNTKVTSIMAEEKGTAIITTPSDVNLEKKLNLTVSKPQDEAPPPKAPEKNITTSSAPLNMKPNTAAPTLRQTAILAPFPSTKIFQGGEKDWDKHFPELVQQKVAIPKMPPVVAIPSPTDTKPLANTAVEKVTITVTPPVPEPVAPAQTPSHTTLKASSPAFNPAPQYLTQPPQIFYSPFPIFMPLPYFISVAPMMSPISASQEDFASCTVAPTHPLKSFSTFPTAIVEQLEQLDQERKSQRAEKMLTKCMKKAASTWKEQKKNGTEPWVSALEGSRNRSSSLVK
ncbi:MAG: hypothetical protein K0R63_252 [Rickettsiales bacterium]|jgi:hypothetical protein|nr:hypothetical protein [Rickettsiales bacterium]